MLLRRNPEFDKELLLQTFSKNRLRGLDEVLKELD